MATTIAGGAFLDADGKTWRDANGVPLNEEQIAEVKRLTAERQQARDAAEQERLLAEGQRDPTTRAVVAALGVRSNAAPVGPGQQRTPVDSGKERR